MLEDSEKPISLRGAVTAVACALLYGFVIGLGSNCKGVFFSVMAEDLGVSLSAVTRYLTFYGITAALCIPLCTWFFLRVPARVSLPVCVLLYAAATFLQGNVHGTAALYALGALRGIPGGFLTTYPMQYIIGNWFPKRKGTVLGFVVMAAGAVGTLFNPIVQDWIDAYGWRSASHIVGSIIFAVGMLACAFLTKAPNGAASAESKPAAVQAQTGEQEKIRTSTLVIYIVFTMLVDLLVSFPQILPSFALSIEKTAEFGAILVSAAMVGNIFFKLLLGVLNDHIGAERTTVLALIPMAITGLLLALTRSEALLLIAAFLSGTVSATYAVQFPLLLRRQCPPVQFAKLFGIICAFNSFVGSLSATVLALPYTATGSFSLSMWFCFSSMVLCAGLCTVFVKRQHAVA